MSMIRIHFIQRVCGHILVHEFCKGMDCLDCPVQKLLDYAIYLKRHPVPEPKEEPDEPKDS